MSDNLLAAVSLIIGLGLIAQWVAWRFRLPSILLLLITGVLLGPVTGRVVPDEMFGQDLVLTVVSVSLALILFEGGLSLRIGELAAVGRVIWNLVTVGVLATWVVGATAAYFFLPLGTAESILLGAILVVTGPTVILPLLRQIRPKGRVASVLKWEGIFNDPVGAALAVLVYEALAAGHGSRVDQATFLIVMGVLKTTFIGFALGVGAAGFLIVAIKRYWIPDTMHNAVALALVLGAFTLSNKLQHESGLLTVTVMGVVLANQRFVAIKHLIEFKENLRVLLLVGLFVLLSARLDFEQLRQLGPGSAVFVAILIFVARPLCVLVSTARSVLSWRERLFIMWMAPRGIVAAAITAVFALRLESLGYEQAGNMVPVTFLLIATTVALYGLTAGALARRLGLAEPNPQGCLIVGGHPLGREMARALKKEGIHVTLVDSNWNNVMAARMSELPAHYGDILSDETLEQITFDGVGNFLALTPNDKVNALAALHLMDVLGRDAVYQLPPDRQSTAAQVEKEPARHLRGRHLFGPAASYSKLAKRLADGAAVRVTPLTAEFTYADFREKYGESALLLFVVREGGRLHIVTDDASIKPQAGQRLISLVDPE